MKGPALLHRPGFIDSRSKPAVYVRLPVVRRSCHREGRPCTCWLVSNSCRQLHKASPSSPEAEHVEEGDVWEMGVQKGAKGDTICELVHGSQPQGHMAAHLHRDKAAAL